MPSSGLNKIQLAVLTDILLHGFGMSSLKRGNGGESAEPLAGFATLDALAYIPFLRLTF